MSDIVASFGKWICNTTPKNPGLSKKALLLAYRSVGIQQRIAPDKKLTPARQYIAKLCSDSVINALAHPEKSALVSILLPCELLDAFGIIPFCAELFSCFINGAEAEKVFIEAAESAGIAETYCSYHKILMGSAFTGVLPKPKAIINTSLVCDANNLTFRALSEYYDIPQFYVDVPIDTSEENVHYVAMQLRDLTSFIEDQEGRFFNGDKLRQAVDRSRLTIENLKKCIPYKRTKYLPGDMTSEMYEVMATHTSMGTKKALNYSRMLLNDYQNAGTVPGVRLLWLHTIPFWQQPLKEFFNFSERYQIIMCDLNYESLVEMDPEKPYESMARRLVYSHFNGTSDNRIQSAAKMCEALDIDGVVYFCHWGCKQTMGAAAKTKETLDAMGYPTLILNGDGCDRLNSPDGQVATRLGAFLEMLEDQKK